MGKGIVLIGFMGAGKTSVGKRLAERLGIPFVDTDARIEQKTGQSISAIFAEQGEMAFRAIETAMLKELAAEPAAVIATGGGIVTQEDNWPLLKALGWVVHLYAPTEALFLRVNRQNHRPLLQTENPRESFESLYQAREALYRQADFVLDTANRSPHEIADELQQHWIN